MKAKIVIPRGYEVLQPYTELRHDDLVLTRKEFVIEFNWVKQSETRTDKGCVLLAIRKKAKKGRKP